jgi:hypothetical protein
MRWAVESTLREIEKVRVKKRTDDILRNDAEADPGRMPRHEKHPKVRNPHCKQQHNTHKSERNSPERHSTTSPATEILE